MLVRRDVAAHARNPRPFLWAGASRRKAAAGALAWIYDRANQVAWAGAAVAALLFTYTAFYAFPHAKLAAQQQERDAIEQESRAFCEKHAMPFGTREHTVCIEDLMDIRANERQRTLADLGIF